VNIRNDFKKFEKQEYLAFSINVPSSFRLSLDHGDPWNAWRE